MEYLSIYVLVIVLTFCSVSVYALRLIREYKRAMKEVELTGLPAHKSDVMSFELAVLLFTASQAIAWTTSIYYTLNL